MLVNWPFAAFLFSYVFMFSTDLSRIGHQSLVTIPSERHKICANDGYISHQ